MRWQDPEASKEQQKYEHPIPSRTLLLEAVTHGHNTLESLNLHFELTPTEFEAVRHRVKAMLRDRQLVEQGGELSKAPEPEHVSGRIQAHAKGFGFLLQPESKDIFLPEREMRRVFHGDLAEVVLTGGDSKGKPIGAVSDVLERKRSRFAGVLKADNAGFYLDPGLPNSHQPIALAKKDVEQHGLHKGDSLIAEVSIWPTDHEMAAGTIHQVLEDLTQREQIVTKALLDHEIPHTFSAQALRQARSHAEPVFPDPLDSKREDLRSVPLVTIDGADSRDFDDAVFAETTSTGTRLVVAIADVSHYVQSGALDSEAYERGTSVYFPQQVIPMLPEELSNGLCSLNPLVDRYCCCVEVELDQHAEVTSYRFFTAMMNSKARLTYDQVNDYLIQGSWLSALDTLDSSGQTQVLDSLAALYDLYKKLSSKRATRGAMEFDTQEVTMSFDEEGLIDQITPRTRGDAHKLIEECMLVANVCAADFALKQAADVLYRNHLPPEAEKSLKLKEYLSGFGIGFPAQNPTHKDYQLVIEAISERPDKDAISSMLLRSMMQANYAHENQGHFGLAYEHYSHFTSPIRRYPDLMLHRGIKNALFATSVATAPESAFAAGEHLSMCERRADDATRDVTAWLKCDFMRAHLGDEFTGVITGVTEFGLFVTLSEFQIDGLVHISQIGDDFFMFLPSEQALVGEAKGQRFAMGESMSVQVASVNMDTRQIDFVPVKAGRSEAKSSLKRSSRKKPSTAAGKRSPANKRSGSAKKAPASKSRAAKKKPKPSSKKR